MPTSFEFEVYSCRDSTLSDLKLSLNYFQWMYNWNVIQLGCIGRAHLWSPDYFYFSCIVLPCNLTITGTFRSNCSAAIIIPWAITSHLMIPPKIFTSMASTCRYKAYSQHSSICLTESRILRWDIWLMTFTTNLKCCQLYPKQFNPM